MSKLGIGRNTAFGLCLCDDSSVGDKMWREVENPDLMCCLGLEDTLNKLSMDHRGGVLLVDCQQDWNAISTVVGHSAVGFFSFAYMGA